MITEVNELRRENSILRRQLAELREERRKDLEAMQKARVVMALMAASQIATTVIHRLDARLKETRL